MSRRPLSPRRHPRAIFDLCLEILAPAEGEEWLVGLVVLLLLLGGVRHRVEPWLRARRASPPAGAVAALRTVDVERFGRVDLNRADISELESLPGIGPRLAARIIEDREQHGPFTTLEDVDRVPGIGPHLLARIRDAATIGSSGVAAPSPPRDASGVRAGDNAGPDSVLRRP